MYLSLRTCARVCWIGSKRTSWSVHVHVHTIPYSTYNDRHFRRRTLLLIFSISEFFLEIMTVVTIVKTFELLRFVTVTVLVPCLYLYIWFCLLLYRYYFSSEVTLSIIPWNHCTVRSNLLTYLLTYFLLFLYRREISLHLLFPIKCCKTE